MEEQKKFKIGDEVRLISGSPTMTVREYLKGNLVQCDWFSNGKFEQRSFHEDQLEIYEYVAPVIVPRARDNHW